MPFVMGPAPPPGLPLTIYPVRTSCFMTTRLAIALAATLGLAMPAYSQAATPATQAAQAANPFSAESPLPLHYPQFDKIKDSDFAPAFDAVAVFVQQFVAVPDGKVLRLGAHAHGRGAAQLHRRGA